MSALSLLSQLSLSLCLLLRFSTYERPMTPPKSKTDETSTFKALEQANGRMSIAHEQVPRGKVGVCCIESKPETQPNQIQLTSVESPTPRTGTSKKQRVRSSRKKRDSTTNGSTYLFLPPLWSPFHTGAVHARFRILQSSNKSSSEVWWFQTNKMIFFLFPCVSHLCGLPLCA